MDSRSRKDSLLRENHTYLMITMWVVMTNGGDFRLFFVIAE